MPDGPDDRLRHRRDRGRGHQARRDGLPEQAARLRARRAAARPRSRPTSPSGASSEAEAECRRRRVLRHGRPRRPAMQELFGAIRPPGAARPHRAHHRRDRHRQGAGRARALHRAGRRKDKPFVVVNCSAVVETLFESELFGHVQRRLHRRDRRQAPASSSRPTAARSSSTRSASCRSTSRPSCCASSRSARCTASARSSRAASTSTCSPRPTAICGPKWPPGASAATSSTGSTSSRSHCRRCASGARTFRTLTRRFVRECAERLGQPLVGPDRRRRARCSPPRRGTATSASCAT